MVETRLVKPPAAPGLAQLAAAGLFGLVVLPALLGEGPSEGSALAGAVRPQGAAWLAAGLLVAIWLLAIAPALARALAGLLPHLEVREGSPDQPEHRSIKTDERSRDAFRPVGAGLRPTRLTGTSSGYWTDALAANSGQRAASLARWLVAVGYVLLVQAILRRPFVDVLGALLESSSVEVIFAAGTLALLLLVLYWLHRAARPLVETATWYALDAIVATTGSERASRPPTAAGESAAMLPSPGGEATRLAGAVAPVGSEATRLAGATVPAGGKAARMADVAPAPDDATRPAASVDSAEATRAAGSLGDETRPADRGAAPPTPATGG